MQMDKVKMGKSRFEDDNFRELYMSKVEAPYLGEFPFRSVECSEDNEILYSDEEGENDNDR